MQATPDLRCHGTLVIPELFSASGSFRSIIVGQSNLAPNGMLIAPSRLVPEALDEVTNKGDTYVVDDSCDFACALVARLYGLSHRQLDSLAVSHRADCVHHQSGVRPKGCVAGELPIPRLTSIRVPAFEVQARTRRLGR